jgi:hypothetical protein
MDTSDAFVSQREHVNLTRDRPRKANPGRTHLNDTRLAVLAEPEFGGAGQSDGAQEPASFAVQIALMEASGLPDAEIAQTDGGPGW